MDQTLSERKRIILQRVASSRAAIKQDLDAAVAVVRGVCDRVSGSRPYLKIGLTVGSGLVGLLLGRRVMHALVGGRGPAAHSAPAAGSGVGRVLGWLLIQAFSSLLLPWVRERLRAPVLTDSLRRMHPSRIFFRWLGLEK